MVIMKQLSSYSNHEKNSQMPAMGLFLHAKVQELKTLNYDTMGWTCSTDGMISLEADTTKRKVKKDDKMIPAVILAEEL